MKNININGTGGEVKVTTQQFADKWGVAYAEAAGFLKMLRKKGLAKEAGTIKATGGKGKGSTVYIIPGKITLEDADAIVAEDWPAIVSTQSVEPATNDQPSEVPIVLA